MDEKHTAKIRELNDAFRHNPAQFGERGEVLVTKGIHTLDPPAMFAIADLIRDFDAFTEDNDPRGEHDFGAFDYDDNLTKLTSRPEHIGVPGTCYARLYQATVAQMQQLDRAIPWAAGIGGDAFRLMCCSTISCKTLGEALQRAQQFDTLVYPLTGHKIRIDTFAATAYLSYDISTDTQNELFAPPEWDLTAHYAALAKSSGLRVRFSFSGWLIGRSITPENVTVSAPSVTPKYQTGLELGQK